MWVIFYTCKIIWKLFSIILYIKLCYILYYISYHALYLRSYYVLYYLRHYFLFYFKIEPQRYSSIQAAQMIMEILVDSGDDSEIGDSHSISSCSASSSSFTDSRSEWNDKITVDQLSGNELGLEVGLLFDRLETQLQQHL